MQSDAAHNSSLTDIQSSLRLVAGEEAHGTGEDGVERARAWLEKTGRVNVNFTVYEVGAAGFLTFDDAKGSEYSFDLSGVLDLDEGKSTFYGEVKKYSVVGRQPDEYTEYLAKCYRAVVTSGHPHHFFWITWHPFSQTKWTNLCTADEIRAALETHQAKYCGADEIDNAAVTALADRLWLVVLSDRQEALSMSNAMLGELRRAATVAALP